MTEGTDPKTKTNHRGAIRSKIHGYKVDLVAWVLVLLFFLGSALISHGQMMGTFLGALAIILVMAMVSGSIEIIIDSLKNVAHLGTITGFITNGPEALCLIVGLAVGDVLFAASTPLGSNVMNPVMLAAAAIITGTVLLTVKARPGYMIVCILLTAILAVGFFAIPESGYIIWIVGAVIVTAILFVARPKEIADEEEEKEFKRIWLLPAILVLILAGYVLDPVVSYTAESSNAPKGIIGFFVLAALTSWPEFKSTQSLLSKRKTLAAILNITVSNITNIWLAAAGVGLYMIAKIF